jgi:YesN/AraC family two-component response regulator
MAKIVIIEDETIVRENLKELLELFEHEVFDGENGKIGLQLIKKHKPDIILCDINMPEMNGFEVLKELQKEPETFTIPFLFLTAFSDKQKFREGMELGADDYITKPYTKDDVLNAIEFRLKKSEKISENNQKKIEELRQNISLAIPHELRTPLNSILGFSQILKDDHKEFNDDELRSMFDNIYDSGKRLLRIINNYIYYNNLVSTPKNHYDHSYFDFDIKDTIQSRKRMLQEKYPEIEIIDKSSSCYLISEPNLIEKMIYELLDNAIKFSDAKAPVEILGNENENYYILQIINSTNNQIDFTIDDIGAFTQFDRDQFEQQGAGLGLAIVKLISNIIDIKLELENNENLFKIKVFLKKIKKI